MQQITVDITPSNNKKTPVFNASQYDVGREFRAKLVDNLVPYTLDGTELLSISVRKGDNTLFTADIANVFGGKDYIDFLSTKQMCAVEGYNYGELSITKNNTRIGLINFTLIIEVSPEKNGLTSQSEINNLNRQIDEHIDLVLPAEVTEIVTPMVDDIYDILNGTDVSNYVEDKNIDNTGAIVDAEGFCVSEKITYNLTGQRRYYCGTSVPQYACAVAFYDSEDNLLGRYGIPSQNGGSYRVINAETLLEETPAYVRFSFVKGYAGKITNNTNTDPIVYWEALKIEDLGVVDKVNEVYPISKQTKTLLGNDSVTSETASLSANTAIELTNAPWFIKKNEGITARVYFNSFTSVSIGKGYEKYRGKWIVIDGTNITPYSSDGETTTAGTPIPHGLTISDYLMIAAYMGNDGKCQIALNTTSGTFFTAIDYSYEWNYAPFLFGAQAMTNVKLSYSSADLRCPLWIIGDSYMGMGAERIGGQLKNLGFINYCIDAIAGGKAIDIGSSQKSLYDDLQKMLAISTPRFLVWAIGMNGGNDANIDFIPLLIDLCEEKDIELILYTPPCVPSRDKTDLNTFIKSTGLRYVNGYDAVGSNAQGVWYVGYLSSDEIHPTQLGAQALAERFLADCPELVQYGKSEAVDLSNYYTKTETNTALSTKADTSTVTSALALKADKSDTYTKSQVDAIVAAAVDSVLPTGNVSGAVATFKTSLEKPLLSLKANIDYKADGVTEVNYSHLGANICEEVFEQGFINASGVETPSSTSIRSKNYNVCIPNQEFYAKTFDDPACYIMFFDASKTFIERKQANNQKVVASATARYFRFSCYNYGQGTYDVVNKPVSINLPSSDTAYHAYSKTVKTVDISDYTIYGGTLEITPTGATLTSTKNADGTDKDTPDVYQITGVTDITPNNGVNNILADTGDVAISFKCTVEDYVEAN